MSAIKNPPLSFTNPSWDHVSFLIVETYAFTLELAAQIHERGDTYDAETIKNYLKKIASGELQLPDFSINGIHTSKYSAVAENIIRSIKMVKDHKKESEKIRQQVQKEYDAFGDQVAELHGISVAEKWRKRHYDMLGSGNHRSCEEILDEILEEQVSITVNGVRKKVPEKPMSYSDVVALAFGESRPGLTITYHLKIVGGDCNRSGILSAGDTVEIADNMIFDVADTSNA